MPLPAELIWAWTPMPKVLISVITSPIVVWLLPIWTRPWAPLEEVMVK